MLRALLLPILMIAGAAHAQAADPSFTGCAACHSLKAGDVRMGPTLYRVVGRAKASVAGYSYSPAMLAQKGAWTPAALDAYLTDPRKAVPGTKMIYPGIADAAKRARLIAYLKTVK